MCIYIHIYSKSIDYFIIQINIHPKEQRKTMKNKENRSRFIERYKSW